MSLQYLKQEVDKVDFLHADKHQSWFQHFGMKVSCKVKVSF